ncbi:hypothetical protein E3P98_00428 [Wallemia ichthyophaga]|nr:hypothetical protein E3P98_00428 [Wallemia ichthyophaga]
MYDREYKRKDDKEEYERYQSNPRRRDERLYRRDSRQSDERKPFRDLHRRSRSPRPSRSKSPSRSPRRTPPEIKPDFSNSGLLAAESKTVNGVVLKYHEPVEAQKPGKGDDWRLFVFKGETQTDMLMLDKQSCYLFGKDANVADYPVAHPSISKQHAVIQYRAIRSKNEFGDVLEAVKPFVLDLESTNGTQVNGEEIPVSRYFEIISGDVIKFGLDDSDFVLIKS